MSDAGHARRPNNQHFRMPGLKFGEALTLIQRYAAPYCNYTVLYINWGILKRRTPCQCISHIQLPIYTKFHGVTLIQRYAAPYCNYTVLYINWGISKRRTPFQCISLIKLLQYTKFYGNTLSYRDILLNTVILQNYTETGAFSCRAAILVGFMQKYPKFQVFML